MCVSDDKYVYLGEKESKFSVDRMWIDKMQKVWCWAWQIGSFGKGKRNKQQPVKKIKKKIKKWCTATWCRIDRKWIYENALCMQSSSHEELGTINN